MVEEGDMLIEHAGLSNDKLNLIMFENEEQLMNILKSLDINVDSSGNILDNQGQIEICPCCQTKITLNNLGNVMPGSRILYCDHSTCLVDYISKFGATH